VLRSRARGQAPGHRREIPDRGQPLERPHLGHDARPAGAMGGQEYARRTLDASQGRAAAGPKQPAELQTGRLTGGYDYPVGSRVNNRFTAPNSSLKRSAVSRPPSVQFPRLASESSPRQRESDDVITGLRAEFAVATG